MRANTIAHYVAIADKTARYDDHDVRGKFSDMSQSPTPDVLHLRAYRHFHPAARVHIVQFSGRIVWMTDKQYDIWCYVKAAHRRNRRITLAEVADRVRCSRATVSRFLHRLDLWRFVDYVALRGRKFGGSWVATVRNRLKLGDAYASGARVTRATRNKARDIMAMRLRRNIESEWRASKVPHTAPSTPVVRMQHYRGNQQRIWGGEVETA